MPRLSVKAVALGTLINFFGNLALKMFFVVNELAKGPSPFVELVPDQPDMQGVIVVGTAVGMVAAGGFVAGVIAARDFAWHGAAVGLVDLLVFAGYLLFGLSEEDSIPFWYLGTSVMAVVPAGALGGYLAKLKAFPHSRDGVRDKGRFSLKAVAVGILIDAVGTMLLTTLVVLYKMAIERETRIVLVRDQIDGPGLLVLGISLGMNVFGGLVAGLVARREFVRHGAAVGVFNMVYLIAAEFLGWNQGSPLWLLLGMGLGVVPAAALGGYLAGLRTSPQKPWNRSQAGGV